MKKINKLAAAMAVALSMTAMPQANAEIEFHPSGRGDALLFPAFNGYIENYFTIMNNHDGWVQGHLRFRGAAWSGEMRDFDVILSPGDVFVFRIADVDGDGQWEIDQSLDPLNFQYTGLGSFTCSRPPVQGAKAEDMPTYRQCMDPSNVLMPKEANIITASLLDYQKHMGYVEFIGEAVLDGMDHKIMAVLLGLDNAGVWEVNQTDNQTNGFNGRGTNAWVWSDAVHGFADDRGLSDVPNALSGTAFLTVPGVGHGLAYNAEAFVNFRTATYLTGDTPDAGTVADMQSLYLPGEHRIDNYDRGFKLGVTFDHPREYVMVSGVKGLRDGFTQDAEDRAVILHHENGSSSARGPSPFGDYVYQFDRTCGSGAPVEDRCDESRISFNNTWGPTLADGDDYDLTTLRTMTGPNDDWDGRLAPDGDNNSIAEIEEAIRLGVSKQPRAEPGPQVFSAYYFDNDIFDKSCEGNMTRYPDNRSFCPNDQSRAKPLQEPTTLSALSSYYFAFFPTKFFYGENALYYGPPITTLEAYLDSAVRFLLTLQKPVYLEVWDTEEYYIPGSGKQAGAPCISPRGPECASPDIQTASLSYELTFLGIQEVKKLLSPGYEGYVEFMDKTVRKYFRSGRVVVQYDTGYNDPQIKDVAKHERSWPGLMYTFEWDGGINLTHWRPMHRMHR